MEPARAFAGVLSHRLWLCLRTGKRKKYSQKPGLATPGNGSAGHRQSLSQPVCTPVSAKPSGDRSGAENFGSRRQPGDDKAKASSRGEAAVGPGVYHSGGFPSDGGFHECERLRPAGENPVQKNPVCLAGWSAFGDLFGRIGVFSSSFWDGEA